MFQVTPEKYSGTSPYGHLFNTDTSIMRTLIPVPLVSVIKRFDCTSVDVIISRSLAGDCVSGMSNV